MTDLITTPENTTPVEQTVTTPVASDKIIGMPTDDEFFSAFSKALIDGVPERKKNIVKMFEPFLAKIKGHIKSVVKLEEKGLAFNVTTEIGDNLIKSFIDSQGVLLRLPLKQVLAFFDADSFTHFIEATKRGSNDTEITINGMTSIITLLFEHLNEKYAIVETKETIKEKVGKVFA